MRLDEVVTESINLSGLNEDQVVEVRVNPGVGTVWMEDDRPVQVRIEIQPDTLPEEPADAEGVGIQPNELS
jgi:hypothetical protein